MGQLASPLKIRAHHLLCLLGFRGLGYNQEFIAVMRKVVERVRPNSVFPVTVIAERDIICAACPHNKEDKCMKKADSERKVKARDLEVLRRLGLEVGAQIPVAKAWARIKGSLSLKDLAEICRDCEWLALGYCAEGLEGLEVGLKTQTQSTLQVGLFDH